MWWNPVWSLQTLEFPANILASVTISHWVSESMCSFCIVKDQGLCWLCKTRQPNLYLPDETTMAKDIKFLYGWSEHRLVEELKVNLGFTLIHIQQSYSGQLAYKLDCWTLPNHCAFMNILVTWIQLDELVMAILDFIKLAKSHSGQNLAEAFMYTLTCYGIADKVSRLYNQVRK